MVVILYARRLVGTAIQTWTSSARSVDADNMVTALKQAHDDIERLKKELVRTRSLLRETMKQHDNGHSPCNCPEIKKALTKGPHGSDMTGWRLDTCVKCGSEWFRPNNVDPKAHPMSDCPSCKYDAEDLL